MSSKWLVGSMVISGISNIFYRILTNCEKQIVVKGK